LTRTAEYVFRGWLALTESEKAEVLEAIKKFQDLPYYEKQRVLTERKVVTGPLGHACPCCGRSY
jgi:hypothetical protein